MQYRTLECHNIPNVKDEELPPVVPDLEAQIGSIRTILLDCPIITTDPSNPSDVIPFNDGGVFGRPDTPAYFMYQPGRAHQRSFVLAVPGLQQPWHDEHGNTYHSLNLKGNNFSRPAIIARSIDREAVSAYGLLESDVIRRVLRGSRLLRAANIGTEYIVGLAEPKEFPWPVVDTSKGEFDDVDYHEPVLLAEYKRRLAERSWLDLPPADRTPESYVATAKKLEHLTFYIMLRAMDTSYRLSDIQNMDTDHFARFQVFDIVNKHLTHVDESPFDASEPEDFYRFGCDYFAPRLASNVAAMHNLGLAHRYLSGNISALGSIVDLDSIHGTSLDLGDEPITIQDMANDLRQAMRSLKAFIVKRQPEVDRESIFANFARTYMAGFDDPEIPDLIAQYIAASMNEMPETGALEQQFNRLVDETFILTYLETYDKKVDLDPLFSEWLEAALPVFIGGIDERVAATLDRIPPLLFDHYLHDLNVDRDMDIVSAFLASPIHDVKQSIMQHILCDFMEEWILVYLEKQEGLSLEDRLEEEVDPELLERFSPKIVLVRDVFLKWFESDGFETIWPLVDSKLRSLKAQIQAKLSFQLPTQDFNDVETRYVTLNPGLQILTEFTGVPFTRAIQHLSAEPGEKFIRIQKMPDKPGGHIDLTVKDSTLHYVITDSPTNSRRLQTLDGIGQRIQVVDLPRQYAVWVTINDEGVKEFVIYTTNEALLDDVAGIQDGKKLLAVLSRHYPTPPTLFD